MFVLFDFLGAESRDAKPVQGLLQTALVELAGDLERAQLQLPVTLWVPSGLWRRPFAPFIRSVRSNPFS